MSSINEKRQRRAPLRLGAGRLAVCALLLVCTLFAFTPSAQADVRRADIVGTSTVEALGLSVAQCPSLDAEYAVLMDSTGRILFDRNAHELDAELMLDAGADLLQAYSAFVYNGPAWPGRINRA